jgi:hypothetical protein
VAVLTGHVLKDPAILSWYHQEAEPAPPGRNQPIEVDANIAAIERELPAL